MCAVSANSGLPTTGCVFQLFSEKVSQLSGSISDTIGSYFAFAIKCGIINLKQF